MKRIVAIVLTLLIALLPCQMPLLRNPQLTVSEFTIQSDPVPPVCPLPGRTGLVLPSTPTEQIGYWI